MMTITYSKLLRTKRQDALISFARNHNHNDEIACVVRNLHMGGGWLKEISSTTKHLQPLAI